ncbi:MAG: CDP-diacylglycerol--serine O-phosphatidyltransferase, partial [Xanthobacteraceae bacterium]
AYPWHVLSAGTILFLCSLPLGWRSYQEQARKAAEAPATDAAGAAVTAEDTPATGDAKPASSVQDRPHRLN